MKKINPPKRKIPDLYVPDTPLLIYVNDYNPKENLYRYTNNFYYLAYTLRQKNLKTYVLGQTIDNTLVSLINVIRNHLINEVDSSMIYNTLLITKLYLKDNDYLEEAIKENLNIITLLLEKTEIKTKKLTK